MTLLIFLILGLCSFAFVILPISGGVILNPLLSIVVDPHTALSLSVFFFVLNSEIKALVFFKDIQKHYVLYMLPISLIASAVGSYVVGVLPEFILYFTLLAMTSWFACKRLFATKSTNKKKNKTGFLIVGGLGGFLQGTGLGGGGSLRKAYFLSENMTLQQMHGTTLALSVGIGLISIMIRLGTDQITMKALSPMVLLIPVMIVSTIVGKKVLTHLSCETSEKIIAITLLLTIALLLVKILMLPSVLSLLIN